VPQDTEGPLAKLEDDRESFRYELNLPANAGKPGDMFAIVILNFSETGLMARLDQQSIDSEKLVVRLCENKTVPADVIWASKGLIGLEFEQRLSPAELAVNRLRSGLNLKEIGEQDMAIDATDMPFPAEETGGHALSKSARYRILVGATVTLWTLIGVAVFVMVSILQR
jgi:hypothetical protein